MIKVVCTLFSLLFWLDVASGQSYWVKTYIAIDARQNYYFSQTSGLNERPNYIIAKSKNNDGILGIGLAKEWKNGSFTDVTFFRQKNNSLQLGFFLDTIGGMVTSRVPQIGNNHQSKFILAMDHTVLLTKPEKLFRFYAGASMMVHSTKFNFKADPLYYFDMNYRFSNLDLGGAIKLTYTILDNLWAELGMALGVLSLGVEDSRVYNPLFTPNQQKHTIFDVEFLQSSHIRLGLGYRLYQKKSKKGVSEN
jgi:hypothetical protein